MDREVKIPYAKIKNFTFEIAPSNILFNNNFNLDDYKFLIKFYNASQLNFTPEICKKNDYEINIEFFFEIARRLNKHKMEILEKHMDINKNLVKKYKYTVNKIMNQAKVIKVYKTSIQKFINENRLLKLKEQSGGEKNYYGEIELFLSDKKLCTDNSEGEKEGY